VCTASLIATGAASWRFVFNRDELRTRAEASPPLRRQVGDLTAAWPVDGEAGGTWIGANDRGLVIALLNRNAEDASRWRGRHGLRSRGEIIPAVIAAADASQALDLLAALRPASFAPYVLVAMDDDRVLTATWDGTDLQPELVRRADPRLWASSGYGDDRVRAPRQAVFARMVAAPTPAVQDAFHASRDGDDHVAWVAMRRDDARSVSRTVIEVAPDAVTMRYAPLDDDGAEGDATELLLERRG